jgi:alpha-beta hydrolase superfamily lysophospholipase
MARDDSNLQTFTDGDGVEISYRTWLPEGFVRAVVVIAHGASEHSARYARFAGVLTAAGYAVYAIDHRGHGATSAATGVGQAGPRGWDGMVDDLKELLAIAEEAHPEVPAVLFGHSMGSFLSQIFAQRYGDAIDALVLSGSAGALADLDASIGFLQTVVDDGGGDAPAPLFDAFNEPFQPARTPFDWLSRDEAEVDLYVADPWCGNDAPLTIGFVLDMMRHGAEAWDPANEARIPDDLPVLFITGERDPVSDGARTVHELEARYRAQGITDVTAHYYADARHELLNETNRDEVHADVLAWLDRVTTS